MRISHDNWLIIILRLGIASLFILVSLDKVFDLESFSKVLRQYNFLPNWTILYLTLLIPAIEYSLGVSLLFGLYLVQTCLMLLGMMIVFSAALFFQLTNGNTGSCGCSGNLLPDISIWWALARNGLIITLLSVLFMHYNNILSFIFLRKNKKVIKT